VGIAHPRCGNSRTMPRALVVLAVMAVGCRACIGSSLGPAVLAQPRVFAVGPTWVGDTSQTLHFGFHRVHTYSCKLKTLDTICERVEFEPSAVTELDLQPSGLFTATDLGGGSVRVSPSAAGTATLSARIRHADGEEGVVQVALDARVPDAVRLVPSCHVAPAGEIIEPVASATYVQAYVTGGDAGLHVSGIPPINSGPFTVSDLEIRDAGLGHASFRLLMPDGGALGRVFAEGFSADGLDFRTYEAADVTAVRIFIGGRVQGLDAGLKRGAHEDAREVRVAHEVGGRPACHEQGSLPRLLTFETPLVCSTYPFPADGGSFEVPEGLILRLGLGREGVCRLRADSPASGFSDTVELNVLPP
jgi:hypothetical protein